MPGKCEMRVSAGDFPPVTTQADNNGVNTYVAGDGRVSEHSVLTSTHTVWLREHNRLCKKLKKSKMSEDAKFDRIKAVRCDARNSARC